MPLLEFTRSELSRGQAAKKRHALQSATQRRDGRVVALLRRLYAASHLPMRFVPILTMGIQVGVVLDLLPLVLCGFAIVLPAEVACQLLLIYVDFD
jgi:hypothetical protein